MTSQQGIEVAEALNALAQKYPSFEEVAIWACLKSGKPVAFIGCIGLDGLRFWAHDKPSPLDLIPVISSEAGSVESRRSARLKALTDRLANVQEEIATLIQPAGKTE